MKKIYIFLLLSVFLSNLSGQTTLTYSANGLVAGDSSRTYDIRYAGPGNSGENQLWDFSGIKYTGKSDFCAVKADPAAATTGNNETGVVLAEDGYDYNYLSAIDGYKENGYKNEEKKLTLNYSEPVLKMKFPFSFGQTFSSTFTGVAWFNENSRIDLDGVYSVTADAYGTLILPGRILKNTLRVKASRQSVQVGVCGSTQSTTVKYYWYAPGYRYPVLMTGSTESRYGVNEPVISKSAWVNLDQHNAGSSSPVADSGDQAGIGENSVIVFPNPFNEQLTYNYFLWKQIPVMVELYDMSGRSNIIIEKKQVQNKGLHSGTLNASDHGLPPGVYYLRFIFDKQLIVSKIVKI